MSVIPIVRAALQSKHLHFLGLAQPLVVFEVVEVREDPEDFREAVRLQARTPRFSLTRYRLGRGARAVGAVEGSHGGAMVRESKNSIAKRLRLEVSEKLQCLIKPSSHIRPHLSQLADH